MSEKAIRFRIYPDKAQQEMFSKTFGCARKIWNLMLADRMKENHEYHTPAYYKKEYPYLKQVDSLALANVQINLDQAYRNYFEKRANQPRFKSKHHSKKTYTTNCQYPKNGRPTIRIHDNSIHLPKIGDVKAVIHRKSEEGWILKSATISEDNAGNYYASVLYHYEENNAEGIDFDDVKVIGLDYKSDGLYMDSNGNCANMPKYFKKSQKKLAKAQRKLSRKKGSKKGEAKSKNWIKQNKRVNKIYTHMANQRKDFLHKQSRQIANACDVVCIEDLDMKAIGNKGFHNGRATMDNGWGMFTAMLAYKLKEHGKFLVKADRWYPSSQICSNCGHQQKMPLHIRTYRCSECGMVMDRDYNSSINLMNEGYNTFIESYFF